MLKNGKTSGWIKKRTLPKCKLFSPIEEINDIIVNTEKILKSCLNSKNVKKKYFFSKINEYCMNDLLLHYPTLLDEVEVHCSNHKNKIFEKVIYNYLYIRVKRFIKSYNIESKQSNKRRKFTKLIHFRNE